MLYKARTEPQELLVFQSLDRRMELTEKDKQYYWNLKKGFEGECRFDSWTEKLECDCLVLNDLRLSVNNTTFQIDALIITGETIYLFEVKNYEGDFYYERERLYKNKSEINNPLIQLKRSESLFRQLLHSLGFDMPVTASIVFIHPEFTLYQAPLNAPFIFPTQIKRYFKHLNALTSKLNSKHKKFAERLLSLHMEELSFTKLPRYEFEQLRKGIVCATCGSFSCGVQGRMVICEECGHREIGGIAIMRSIKEFRMLFPDEKLTSETIGEWCKIIDSKRRISRVLEKHFKTVGTGRWTYYQ
ncbi:hypothetical protein BpJC7_11410 [Weizmannia acidilactici]|uniref:NERD domain-containing protein n=1 Tax=Weizmannia acidilactici TaxID=2607726 RepID=A0A5J4JHG0_9BACI|nr:NERD domain-containing protein [Weizmannia acidilactici]GER68495.1 hypothetical protein BpJC4_29660 [Weizmannia acidilactici]GER69838.1 hypothetical protein BpJC7_11410 [Weizmannia acidilactici]GER75211.1 hypothetical protein BpPP18_32780 [Weizmannia acidilactici]